MANQIFRAQIPVSSTQVSSRRAVFDPGIFETSPFFPRPPRPLPPIESPPPPPTEGPRPAPPAQTPPVTPTQPLASLNIPIAQEGLPITSDYHNSLRDAIIAVAQHLGISQVTAGATLSFAPAFYPHGTDPQWTMDYGFASKPAGVVPPAIVKGWMPVGLPDGARIQSMTLVGTKGGTITAFDVVLVRMPFAATDVKQGTALISIGLKDMTTSPVKVTNTVVVPGVASGFGSATEQAALRDLKAVDTGQYKYLVTAEVQGDANSSAQIATIEITIEV